MIRQIWKLTVLQNLAKLLANRRIASRNGARRANRQLCLLLVKSTANTKPQEGIPATNNLVITGAVECVVDSATLPEEL